MGNKGRHAEIFVCGAWMVGCLLWTGWVVADPVQHISRAESVPDSYSVLVKICDGTGLDASILKGARREATDIYRNAAIDVLWRTDCSLIMDPKRLDSASIYVVAEIPKPLLIRLQHLEKKRWVLATAFPDSDGRVGQVIYVSRKAVEAQSRAYHDGKVTDRILARALGRVFAHELAHRFVQASHSRVGILRESFNVQDLVGEVLPQPFFDRGQIVALRKVARKASTSLVVASSK